MNYFGGNPFADQVLLLASGVCPVVSIKLSHYIKYDQMAHAVACALPLTLVETFDAIKVQYG